MDNLIQDYCESIITGVGGLHDFEKYELAVPKVNRDVATAMWVIKCLANPDSKGSAEVLKAIQERRRDLEKKSCGHPFSAIVSIDGTHYCSECLKVASLDITNLKSSEKRQPRDRKL